MLDLGPHWIGPTDKLGSWHAGSSVQAGLVQVLYAVHTCMEAWKLGLGLAHAVSGM